MNFDDILKLALSELEQILGKRNHSKNILPVEVHSNSPQIFYPNQNSIQVKVTDSCLIEKYRAYYQLGHEAVHILSPVDLGKTTVLEEGVAVWFSHTFMSKHSGNTWNSSGDVKYDRARALVEQLLVESKTALKDIRDKFGCFSPLTAENILEVAPTCDKQLAIFLSDTF